MFRQQDDDHESIRVLNPYDRKTVALDVEIAPVVTALWERGVPTFSSCQGEVRGPAYITLRIESLPQVLRMLCCVDLRGWEFDTFVEREEGQHKAYVFVKFPHYELPQMLAEIQKESVTNWRCERGHGLKIWELTPEGTCPKAFKVPTAAEDERECRAPIHAVPKSIEIKSAPL